jgi:hypothetical protein
MHHVHKYSAAIVIIIALILGSSILQFAFAPDTNTAHADITTGLVGHWKFDEGSGTSAADSSGNNNTGTLTNGPMWAVGKVGQALDFLDGANDTVNAGSASAIDDIDIAGSGLTASAWIYVKSFSPQGTIVGKGNANNSGNWFLFLDGPAQTLRFLKDYDGATDLSVRTDFPNTYLNAWKHVVMTWDGAASSLGVKFYIDGVEITARYSTTSGAGNKVSDGSNSLTIGSNATGTQYPFSGTLDEVRIYNRALSASEITDLYNYTGAALDTQAPSVPTGLTATAVSSSQIDLSWTASTDDVGVTGYRIYRGGVEIATSTTTSHSNTGLSASTTYTYTVAAYDAAGNQSAQSASASATTQAPAADTTPPVLSAGSPSGTLSAGTTSTTLALTTNESATCKYSTTTGVAYASMANTFGTTGGTSHSTSVTGLSDGNTYNYYVRCQDTAGNPNTTDYTIAFSVASAGGATINAASCSRTDVGNAVAAAVNGDTVQVPAGTCTWTSNLSLTKGVHLIGAGIGKTNITGNYTGSWLMSYTPANYSANWPLRISGFTFDFNKQSGGVILNHSPTNFTLQTNIRIDHNEFKNASTQALMINGYRGVADNNVFTGTAYPVRFASGASKEWWNNWEGLVFGGANNNFYFADNTFSVEAIVVDCQFGNRYAFRYNTIVASNPTGSYPLMDMHGNAGQFWSCFGGEIYGNNITVQGDGGQILDQRGGKTVVFYNQVNGKNLGVKIREEVDDASHPTTNSQPQHVSDTYIWSNWKTLPSLSAFSGYVSQNICNEVFGVGSDECDDIEEGYSLNENDEYFLYKGSFDGTTGVGAGPLSSRPTTCTTGVGYWATNQSTTDLTGMVGAKPAKPISGTLYKCTSINTWTAYYTPYTYPHPLVSGSTTTPTPTPSATPTPTPTSTSTQGSTAPLPTPIITNIQATNVTHTFATVTWTTDVPSTSKVNYGLTSSYTTSTVKDNTLVTAHSVTIGNLNASTLYHFQVESADAANGNALSADNTLTTSPPPVFPVISNVQSANVTQTSATVTWTTSVPSGSQVEYGQTTRYGSSTTRDSAQVTAHTVMLTGLSAGTQYNYRVKSGGSVSTNGFFSTAPGSSPDTTPPAAIGSLTILKTTRTSVELEWTAPGDDNTTGTAALYTIRYSSFPITDMTWSTDSNLTGAPVPAAAGTKQTYTAIGLSPDSTYYFAIKARDEAFNFSPLSNVVCAKTLPNPPSGGGGDLPPAAVKVQRVVEADKQILFEWTNPTDLDFARTILIRRLDIDTDEKGITLFEDRATAHIVANLENKKEYTFAIYTLDLGGNKSKPVIIKAKPKQGVTSFAEREAPTDIAPTTTYVPRPSAGGGWSSHPQYPSGTILKYALGKDIYLIEKSKKRLITNYATLLKLTSNKPSRVISVPLKDYLNVYESGPPISLADAKPLPSVLVKLPDDPKVYSIDVDSQTRRHISSLAAFHSYGFSFKNISLIDQQTLDAYAEGEPLTFSALPDGSLIKAAQDPKVYIIQDGQKRWITTYPVFKAYRFKPDKIVTLPKELVDHYQASKDLDAEGEELTFDVDGTVVSPAEPYLGKLVKTAADPKIWYVTQKGVKRWVPTIEVFLSYGNDFKDVIEVDPSVIAAIPDNTLIAVPGDPKVYRLENGTKTWIKTAEDFTAAGYRWDLIAPVNATELNAYPDGN